MDIIDMAHSHHGMDQDNTNESHIANIAARNASQSVVVEDEEDELLNFSFTIHHEDNNPNNHTFSLSANQTQPLNNTISQNHNEDNMPNSNNFINSNGNSAQSKFSRKILLQSLNEIATTSGLSNSADITAAIQLFTQNRKDSGLFQHFLENSIALQQLNHYFDNRTIGGVSNSKDLVCRFLLDLYDSGNKTAQSLVIQFVPQMISNLLQFYHIFHLNSPINSNNAILAVLSAISNAEKQQLSTELSASQSKFQQLHRQLHESKSDSQQTLKGSKKQSSTTLTQPNNSDENSSSEYKELFSKIEFLVDLLNPTQSSNLFIIQLSIHRFLRELSAENSLIIAESQQNFLLLVSKLACNRAGSVRLNLPLSLLQVLLSGVRKYLDSTVAEQRITAVSAIYWINARALEEIHPLLLLQTTNLIQIIARKEIHQEKAQAKSDFKVEELKE
jgi:hypothetical protein